GELPGDVQPEARASRPGGEEGLENLAAQLGGNARPVIAHLTDDGIAHVAGTTGDADAALLFLAVLPRIAHKVPHDLIQVTAIEDDLQIVGNENDHRFRGDVLGLHDLVDQRAHEFAKRDGFGLLAVATIELQHFTDDAVDALGVVAD